MVHQGLSALEAALAAQTRPTQPGRRNVLGLAVAGLAASWLQGCASTGASGAAESAAQAAASGTAGGGSATPQPATAAPTVTADPPGDAAPPIRREFRAAWVASVAHIDWPSRRGLTTAQQRAEMIELLDKAQAIGLNAIVLQVRPAADALYPSALEPWSEYLTGASGRPPETAWDPLAEWVDQAHRRGLELHAWFNPYRARHPSATSALAANHLALTDPGIVKRYGDLLWMDPGEPRAAQRMVDVVLDVVQRYDIDGVHIDDYFYPYPVKDAQGQDVAFPDEPSWQRAQRTRRAAGDAVAGGEAGMSGGAAASALPAAADRAAWRRAQVDALVERLHAAIHTAKPWVRFGISPFGLPRPDRRPPGITGFSQYDQLYADVERWLSQGWLDYLAPQLYWPIAQAAQAFPVLLDTWLSDNPRGRHIWAGLYTSRIGNQQRPYTPQEVLAQIEVVRQRATAQPLANGHLHFSMAALTANREGVADRLREGPYAQAAIAPATPWLAEPPPARPEVRLTPLTTPGSARLAWQRPAGSPPWRSLVLQLRGAGQWQTVHLPVPGAAQQLLDDTADRAVLRAVGRTGLESPRAVFDRTPTGWRAAG
jgi:uncharacterized lipoprotein YddW (UPF0748 family)